MHLDDSILQSKTANTIINILKEARTITKTGNNSCKAINEKIEYCVEMHDKAINKVKAGKQKETFIQKSTFNGRYRVNL